MRWWQGSLISDIDLSRFDRCDNPAEWWVIASQTCNLYNPCFDNVPYFELVAAKRIEKCEPGKSRGDHPRILHVEAQSKDQIFALELNIQNRRWCKREILGKLPAPTFSLIDAKQQFDPGWIKKQWLDKFICWLTRSYTRVTLPDHFNDAVRKSKIEDVFKKKLSKNKDELYGIYLSLHSDSDDPYDGVLGEMLPPYLHNIVLVVNEDVDPEPVRNKLLESLFREQISDPENTSMEITRAQLARRHQIRVMEADIEARSVANFTLAEHKSLVRYSLVDHLSDSSLTMP